MKRVVIGLIGLGTVGQGVVKVLNKQSGFFRSKLDLDLTLKHVVDIDPSRKKLFKFARGVFHSDAAKVIDDPEVEIVIELIGGLDAARDYILRAIRKGKDIITANKALLAEKGDEIFSAAAKNGVTIGFEAAVCGGVPVIMGFREGLIANEIDEVMAILNGTSNYILTEMVNNGTAYADALADAKRLGYAEADPTLDVGGMDAAHKIALLSRIGFVRKFRFRDIYVEGIQNLKVEDLLVARDYGYKVKLVAIARSRGERLDIRVHPTLLKENFPLARIDGVNNAVLIEGDAVRKIVFAGPGAGMMPTASAVVSDIISTALNRASEGFETLIAPRERVELLPIGEVECSYYVHHTVRDMPGVLAQIAGIFARNGISIRTVLQRPSDRRRRTPVMIMTHKTREKNLRTAVAAIDRLKCTITKTAFIRVEEG